MKILLDHCVPKRFKSLLARHEVRTAYEMGWAGLKNGELLAEASALFEAFLTVDQNVRYQQNLSVLPLAVVILVALNNRFETLKPYAPLVHMAMGRLTSRTLVRIEGSGRIEVVGP